MKPRKMMKILVRKHHTSPVARFLVLLLLRPVVARSSAAGRATTAMIGNNKDQLPPLSYAPGNFSEGQRSLDEKILLSNGLSAVPIAFMGEYVPLVDGTLSTIKFHKNTDAAGVFQMRTGGGWLYVSNAENESNGTQWDDGGVGAIEFNQNGEIVGYSRIANYTSRNCGGGKSLWMTWLSGEEVEGGRFVQVDPFGIKPPVVLDSLGTLGFYESFAYDNHSDIPRFYTTRDNVEGVVTRFTPDERGYACFLQPNDYDRWCTLEYGTIDYLYLKDDVRVDFKTDVEKVNEGIEGIDSYNGTLYFTAKVDRLLYVVNLLTMEYEFESTTKAGQVSFEPDQIVRIEGNEALYFCEEGGDSPGIHVRHGPGRYTTLLHIDENFVDIRNETITEETVGLAFSPDAIHLYVAFQEMGILYDVTRDDMRSFRHEFLDTGTSGSGVPSVWICAVLFCWCQAMDFLF